MLSPKFFVRVTLLSVAIGVAMVGALKLAVPMVQLPPWWRFALILPTIFGYMLIMSLVHIAIPSRVEVRPKRVLITTGQTSWLVKAAEIRGARIVVFGPRRVRLRILYERRGEFRSRTVGVSHRVDLAKLAEALPVEPVVWDAREPAGRAVWY